MKNQKGVTTVEMLFVALMIGGAIGWILNIVKIIASLGDVVTGMFIARCIGAFVAPIGAVLGWF